MKPRPLLRPQPRPESAGVKKGRRVVFPEVMQTRVPTHIREAMLKDIKKMEEDGIYRSEADWIREAVITKLKDKKLV